MGRRKGAMLSYYPLGEVARGVEYLRMLFPVEWVDFELLPRGEWLTGEPNGAPATFHRVVRADLPERLRFLERLHPSQVVESNKALGSGRFYRGYIFRDYVLVESTREGNALYIFRANGQWLQLIQLSKLDLLTGNYPDFICRVVHQGDWQSRVLRILQPSAEGMYRLAS